MPLIKSKLETDKQSTIEAIEKAALQDSTKAFTAQGTNGKPMTVSYDAFLQNNLKIAYDHSKHVVAETRALQA